MKREKVKQLYQDYLLDNYAPYDLCITKAKGSFVWDIEGEKYLDFFPGYAVSCLGHCHPKVMSAVRDQVKKVIHIPNIYFNLQQAKLAELLSKEGIPSKSFFCNSGAEANEAAIKFVRRWGSAKGKYEIISLEKSFHGRTFGAMMATGQKKIHEGYGPMLEGFRYAKLNDIDSVKACVTDKTAAIMLELVQGEGGVHIASPEFVKQLRELCDEKELLLVFDEVQTGIGRTGKMFAYQYYDAEPDLVTLAKSLGGGLPIGALVMNKKIKNVLTLGTHGSTFGGSSISCAAALAVIKEIKRKKLLSHTNKIGDYFVSKLKELKEKYPVISEIRALGVMVGVELIKEALPYAVKAFEKKLLINCTQGNVLRIIPAMNVKEKEVDQAIRILTEVFEELK